MFDAEVWLGVDVAGAAFGEEAADVVFGVGVRAGGDTDAVGAFEVVAGGEVAAGALDEPLQDAGAFVMVSVRMTWLFAAPGSNG